MTVRASNSAIDLLFRLSIDGGAPDINQSIMDLNYALFKFE